jgi:uncharacterized membrane protein (GlpM family)
MEKERQMNLGGLFPVLSSFLLYTHHIVTASSSVFPVDYNLSAGRSHNLLSLYLYLTYNGDLMNIE